MKIRNRIITSDLEYITGNDLPWERFAGKTVLVSGAYGFIPSYIVDTLLYLNETHNLNVKVVGMARQSSAVRSRFDYAKGDGNLRFIVQDVCDRIAFDDPVDYIIHAASNATPKVFGNDPVGTILPNVVGTNNLLALAAKNKGCEFLFVSTSGVYGFLDASKYPPDENCFGALNPTNLASCYLESKRMGENMCIAWMHQYNVLVRIVRPAITYGHGIKFDDGRAFADFISCLVRNKDIELYSDGSAIRNFCYIADVILGFFTVMFHGAHGEAYNVATNHEISIKDLAEYLVHEVFPEKRLKVIMKTDPSKDFLRMQFQRTSVDISKLQSLGWCLSYPIAEGFKRTIQSYEN